MAYSLVRVGARVQSAGATTLTPTKPTVDSSTAGAMLAVLFTKNNATHATATSGWSLVSQVNSGASFTASLWIARASAAAPVFTWTGSVACAAQIAYVDGAEGVVSLTPGAISSNSGTTATHSTASLNSTRAGATVVYIDVAAANTAMAAPSGWTELADAGSATDAGRHVWGSKDLTTSGSASGAISVTGANAAWVQWQVQMADAAAAGAETSKLETGAWLDIPSGAVASKMEIGAWLDLADCRFSKIEIGAWLDPVSGYSGIRSGVQTIGRIYHGATAIGKVYAGADVVFHNS